MKRISLILSIAILLVLISSTAARGASLPDNAYVSGLVSHAQGYSLSCESRSAVDMAAYWGVSIGETEFLNSLPQADNPEQGFVGDPNDSWGGIPPHGYGVHAGPIAKVLREFGLQAEAHDDLTWDDLRGEISAGRPVIVWIIGAMWEETPVEYEAPDGSTARVAAFEHTMILIGYSRDTVQVADAYSGQYQTYSLSTFEKSWAVLGNMAVFASYEAPETDQPVETEPHADAYTVQPGEYLVQLAERFGSSWLELAQLNSISYPYTIYPGQVLQLPAVKPAEPEPARVVVPGKAVETTVYLPLISQNYASHKVTPADIISAMASRFAGMPAKLRNP